MKAAGARERDLITCDEAKHTGGRLNAPGDKYKGKAIFHYIKTPGTFQRLTSILCAATDS